MNFFHIQTTQLGKEVQFIVFVAFLLQFITASIIGAVESAILERSIAKEDFKLLDYHLPDWMSCNSQSWGSLQQVSPQKVPSAAQPGKAIQTVKPGFEQ